MKVLVYFKQEYVTTNSPTIKMSENLARIIEAKSNEDLLEKFEKLDSIPKYWLWITGKHTKISKKTMLWYLPESNKPLIEG